MNKCKQVTLRWFRDVAIGGLTSDTGWVIGFHTEEHGDVWAPPLDRDYMMGRRISTNQRRALVRRAASVNGIKLASRFEMLVDSVEGV